MAEMGRPRIYDREQIAIDLVKWAELDDSINLNQFCFHYNPKIPPSYITDWAKEDKDFSAAYEKAKAALGYRRELLLSSNQLHVKCYDLNATTYDHFLKTERRQAIEHEAKVKAQAEQVLPESLQAQYELLIKSFQKQKLDQ